jgi:hypothetical protein
MEVVERIPDAILSSSFNWKHKVPCGRVYDALRQGSLVVEPYRRYGQPFHQRILRILRRRGGKANVAPAQFWESAITP